MKTAQDRGWAQTWAAIAVFAVTVALFAAETAFGWLTRGLPSAGSWSGDNSAIGFVLEFVLLVPPAVGLLVVSRRGGNAIGWLLLGIGLAWGLADSSSYSDYAVRLHPGSLPIAAVPGAIGSAFWVSAIGLTGTFLILLFPDGRLPGPRWRWVAYLSAFVMAASTLALLFAPGDMADAGYSRTENPLGVSALAGVAGVPQYIIVLVPPMMAASAAGMIVRYRRSRGLERLQMRWLTASAGAVAVIYASAFTLSVTIAPNSSHPPTWLAVAQDIALISTALIPIAIGFAVLRYRLYDIDVIIRRTLTYGALVASLAAVYVGGIALIGATFRTLTGLSNSVAVTISTLAVAAAFHPLRSRIQAAVDRRFYRARYDAAQTLDAFSVRLREEIDLDALSGEVLAVVADALHTAHAGLWLRPMGGGI